MRKMDHDEEREKIAEAAAKLISEVGAQNLTIEQVAKAFDATRGKILHYYSSKQEVIEAAFSWASRRGIAHVQDSIANTSSVVFDMTVLTGLLPLTPEAEIEWRVRLAFLEYSLTNKERSAYQYKIANERVERITLLIQYLQDSGQAKQNINAKDFAQQLHDMMAGLGITLLFIPMEERLERSQGIIEFLMSLSAMNPKEVDQTT